MHTSLTGENGHDNYAPCSLHELTEHGFNYWALGHIHQRRVYSDSFPCIVMPGIPQGRDIGEEGLKSVTIVEISDQHTQLNERFVSDTEFKKIQVDLSNIIEWQQALELIQNTLEKIRNSGKATNLICRIILTGHSPLYWHLHRDFDLFEAEIKEILKRFEGLFLDDLKIEIDAVVTATNDTDPTIELEGYMKQVMMNDAFCAKINSFFDKAVRQIPQELRNEYGVDQEGRKSIIQHFLSEGITHVIASLKGSSSNSEVF